MTNLKYIKKNKLIFLFILFSTIVFATKFFISINYDYSKIYLSPNFYFSNELNIIPHEYKNKKIYTNLDFAKKDKFFLTNRPIFIKSKKKLLEIKINEKSYNFSGGKNSDVYFEDKLISNYKLKKKNLFNKIKRKFSNRYKELNYDKINKISKYYVINYKNKIPFNKNSGLIHVKFSNFKNNLTSVNILFEDINNNIRLYENIDVYNFDNNSIINFDNKNQVKGNILEIYFIFDGKVDDLKFKSLKVVNDKLNYGYRINLDDNTILYYLKEHNHNFKKDTVIEFNGNFDNDLETQLIFFKKKRYFIEKSNIYNYEPINQNLNSFFKKNKNSILKLKYKDKLYYIDRNYKNITKDKFSNFYIFIADVNDQNQIKRNLNNYIILDDSFNIEKIERRNIKFDYFVGIVYEIIKTTSIIIIFIFSYLFKKYLIKFKKYVFLIICLLIFSVVIIINPLFINFISKHILYLDNFTLNQILNFLSSVLYVIFLLYIFSNIVNDKKNF